MPAEARAAETTLTVRDHFALALAPALVPIFGRHPISLPLSGPDDGRRVARECYKLADAFLAERRRGADDAG
jgi:hypothetical protein